MFDYLAMSYKDWTIPSWSLSCADRNIWILELKLVVGLWVLLPSHQPLLLERPAMIAIMHQHLHAKTHLGGEVVRWFSSCHCSLDWNSTLITSCAL